MNAKIKYRLLHIVGLFPLIYFAFSDIAFPFRFAGFILSCIAVSEIETRKAKKDGYKQGIKEGTGQTIKSNNNLIGRRFLVTGVYEKYLFVEVSWLSNKERVVEFDSEEDLKGVELGGYQITALGGIERSDYKPIF